MSATGNARGRLSAVRKAALVFALLLFASAWVLFFFSLLYAVAHLLLSAWGFAAAKAGLSSKLFLVLGGAGYLMLWFFTQVMQGQGFVNFHWTHLVLGVLMVGSGLVLGNHIPRDPADVA